MMVIGRLAVLIALLSLSEYASGVLVDHADEPSMSLDYNTVTEIIEALNSEENSDTSIVQDPDDDFQDYPGNDILYNYVYENHPEDLFQRRSGGYAQRRRKNTKKQRSPKIHYYYSEHTEEPEIPENFPEPEPVSEESESLDGPCEVPSEELPSEEETIEYTSAEDSYGYVGSLRGRPGIDYPNYKEIPLTSFTCADKEYIPGFYADVETRCQVFHVCYPHRRESFLCPVGTVFNQPIKACDYWYNGNCSSSSEYYDVNEVEEPVEEEITEEDIKSVIDELFPEIEPPCAEEPITEPEEIEPVQVTTPIYVEPEVEPKPVIIEVPEIPQKPIIPKRPIAPSPVEVPSIVKFIPVKAKVTKFVIPIAGKVKAKSILSSAVKGKVTHVKAPIKIAKVKVAPLKAIPVAKVLKAAPVFKKAAVANKVFFVKTKIAAPFVKPVLFKKAAAANALLLKKAKIAKAKKIMAAKAAVPVVSALTKKHLALSLVKMLKAQKLRGIHGYPFRYGYKH